MRWHYTVGLRMTNILSDGCIKPATAFVPKGVRPIVWFTCSPVWEETANKCKRLSNGKVIDLSREETEKEGGGLFRIGVSDNFHLHPYWRISRESHDDPRNIQALLETAIAVGSNPELDWFGTFRRVMRADWMAVEQFTPDGWRGISPLMRESSIT